MTTTAKSYGYLVNRPMKKLISIASTGVLALFSMSASAALVSVSFEILSWEATFAEQSTLVTDPAVTGAPATYPPNSTYTTWQGASVTFSDEGGEQVRTNVLPSWGAGSPLTEVSPRGVLHSAPVSHVIAAPAGATSVTFADRIGLRRSDGSYFYPAFDVSSERDNVLSFNAAPAINVALGETFRLGTFTMRNGSFHSINNGGEPVEVTFRLTTHSEDTAFDGFSVVDTFVFESIGVPGGSALDNADVFTLRDNSSLGAVRVLEGETGTIDLFGSINSLHLISFGNTTGGVALQATTFVSEPPAAAILGLALAALALVNGRGRRSRHALT